MQLAIASLLYITFTTTLFALPAWKHKLKSLQSWVFRPSPPRTNNPNVPPTSPSPTNNLNVPPTSLPTTNEPSELLPTLAFNLSGPPLVLDGTPQHGSDIAWISLLMEMFKHMVEEQGLEPALLLNELKSMGRVVIPYTVVVTKEFVDTYWTLVVRLSQQTAESLKRSRESLKMGDSILLLERRGIVL